MGNLGFSLILELIITSLFCMSLYNTLLQVRPENRKIQPWLIFGLFFPYISIILNFFVVWGMSASIKKELEERDYEVDARPTFLPGIIYAVITLAMSIMVLTLPFMDMAKEIMENRTKHPEAPLTAHEQTFLILGAIALVRIIFFIQYWIKTNWYRKVLINNLH